MIQKAERKIYYREKMSTQVKSEMKSQWKSHINSTVIVMMKEQHIGCSLCNMYLEDTCKNT